MITKAHGSKVLKFRCVINIIASLCAIFCNLFLLVLRKCPVKVLVSKKLVSFRQFAKFYRLTGTKTEPAISITMLRDM